MVAPKISQLASGQSDARMIFSSNVREERCAKSMPPIPSNLNLRVTQIGSQTVYIIGMPKTRENAFTQKVSFRCYMPLISTCDGENQKGSI